MSTTPHVLTQDTYLYSFIDINTFDADKDDPPLKLAITEPGKSIAMFNSDGPKIINPEDKLTVNGSDVNKSDREELAKLFYFTGKTLIYKPGWVNGNGYFFFGVNCNGNSILCVPQERKTPTVVRKFDLPLLFNWSKYKVNVPDSPFTVQETTEKLKMEIQQKERRISELEQQLPRSDQPGDSNGAKIKELEDKQSKLNKELKEINEELVEKERKIKELEDKQSKLNNELKERNEELEGKERKIKVLEEQQEEKNKDMAKLSQELSTLKSQLEDMKEKERKNDELRQKLQSESERKLQEKEMMENKIKEFEENESKLKHELAGKQNEIGLLMQQYEEKKRGMENEIASLNQKLSALREQTGKNANEMTGEEKEEEMKKLKEHEAMLEQEMEKKSTKITELNQQLRDKDERVARSDFQLITSKLDVLLTTILTGHLPQTLLQPMPAPEVVRSRRRSFVPDKFSISPENLPHFTKQAQFHVSIKNLRVFTPMDEDVDGKFPKEEICVYTSDHRFHRKEWWCVKVAEHSKMTMLGFYEGDVDEVSVYGKYVRVPFRPETSFRSNTQFFVGLIRGVGLRFMFLYELI